MINTAMANPNERWKNDASDFARALDAASHALLHGDRAQQKAAATAARGLLVIKGYAFTPPQLMRFDVTARTATGFQSWIAVGRSSIDVLLEALNHFGEQDVTVRVRVEA